MAKIDFYTKSLRGKIIAIFLIAALSIALSWIISRIAFGRVVTSMAEVSKPNDRLHILNKLSNDITQIGQYQQKQILKNPTKTKPILLPETELLSRSMDTLRILYAGDLKQMQQIDSIGLIINQYDALIVNYLKLYAGLFSDKMLTKKLQLLSILIYDNALKMDSSVITSEKRGITITTLSTPDQLPKLKQRTTLIKKIFGSEDKNSEFIPLQKIIEKEHSVRIDTLIVSQRDSLKRAIEESVKNIDRYHRDRSTTLANSELNLIHDVNEYINRIRKLLRVMENHEIIQLKANDLMLIETVKQSMVRITVIMVLFILITTILVYLIFSDISRNNQYRKQLLASKEEAEYLSTVKQRFLSNMSHEIRTPLQSIIGFSEQLMKQDYPSKEAIEAINYSSEHLMQIVNEVLDYSRIVSGKFTFEKKSFNMNELLTEVTATMKLQATEKDLQLVLKEVEQYHRFYLGDQFRLKQILYNLIGNAIKFTDKGSIRIEIETTQQNKRIEFLFKIIDTGIGISEMDFQRIFNEFEQADSNAHNSKGGTGLGLNIVKALVEQQGGIFRAKSKLNTGSVFSVILPFEEGDEIKEAEYQKGFTNQIEYNGKVLIIDDDPFILKLCSSIFSKYDIQHSCQSSPELLIKQIWDNDISLILMDIRMPGINGIELCKLLRNKIEKEVKIIALTAHALQEEQIEILKQGFDGLITKPFKEMDLISCLKNHMEATKRLDFSALLSMCMNDQDLMKKSLSSFIEETTQDLTILRLLILQQDNNEIMEIMHKLAGRIGQVGNMPLSFKLRKIEKILFQNQTIKIDTNELEDLTMEINKFIEAVKLEINQV